MIFQIMKILTTKEKMLQSIFKGRGHVRFYSQEDLMAKNKEMEKIVFGEIISNKSIIETSNDIFQKTNKHFEELFQ